MRFSSVKSYNSQGRVMSQPRAENSVWVTYLVAETQVLELPSVPQGVHPQKSGSDWNWDSNQAFHHGMLVFHVLSYLLLRQTPVPLQAFEVKNIMICLINKQLCIC